MNHELSELRKRCPLPVLMTRLGLERFAKKSCPSPFRPDQNASWGIYEKNGRWRFKDFATGECGDEIALLAHVYQLDQKKEFPQLMDLYAAQARGTAKPPTDLKFDPKPDYTQEPDTRFLSTGTDDQIKRLSELRKISIEGLRDASSEKFLKFGVWAGHEVFAVTDIAKKTAELRRLDGQMFEAYGSMPAHKSHTLKHSRKNWPLGIIEAADSAAIALVEGLPDFLALHQIIKEEGMGGWVGPVAMLTSSCEIDPNSIDFFKGKKVRIFPHQDKPGVDAAERWENQLYKAGAKHVDFFNFRAFEFAAGSCVKDLCDFNQHRGEAGLQQQPLLKDLVS
ncbi:MAG: hypothetical protein WCH99_00430 [Verrucomicrobiota bacterium]